MSGATSSSEVELWALDTMILVYALLDDHPASEVCEEFIRQKQGWITSALHLLETYSVLTKIYGVSLSDAAQAIQHLQNSPLRVVPVDGTTAGQATQIAVNLNLDLTDAVLLETCRSWGVKCVATEDKRLTQICTVSGLQVETPLDEAMRLQVSQWESAHLPQKGAARVLRRVHTWLGEHAPEVSELFWNHTGGCSHLP